MPSLILAFITFFCWGVGDLFGAIASRKLGGYSNAFYFLLIGFILLSFYVPFSLSDLNKFNNQSLLISILLMLLAPIPLVAFYEGLRKGNAAVVGTITSAFAAVSVLISIIFLGERIDLNQGISIIVIFLGIILSSFDYKKLTDNFFADPGLPYAILAMVLWGVYFAFIKIPIKQVGWFWPGYITNLSFVITFFIMKIKNIKLVRLTRKTFKFPLLAAFIISMGGVSYSLAISKGLVAVVTPISSSSITLFVLLTFLVFKDPITKQQILGIITTLIGIVLLSIFSV